MAVFIDFLDKVKNATEKIIKDERFKNSRIVVQEQLKDLKRIAKQISDEDKDGSHREVESEYFKVAPPINSKPMGFLSYLTAEMYCVKSAEDEDHEIDKLFVLGSEAFLKFLDNVKMKAQNALTNNNFKRSGNEMQEMWKNLKELMSGVIAEERAKGNRDDFLIASHAQVAINQVVEKAMEISALERQTEKNDFAVSLREMIYELWTVFENEILSRTKNLHTTSEVDNMKNPLTHLHTIKEMFFDIWDQVLSVINGSIKEDEVQESLRHWDEVKAIFLKVLTDSGEITQENLDEAAEASIEQQRTL
ncbi:hypothetical protein E1301_Tti016685 [Triplophysa tibetana]|uniref:Uncharacterized protein n=1 Tax=Triplophysa tibetana TaxID=1572043 RepID=A0A5A9NL44_9TELE|nr:hypothetical protein E1301_Tti016685 [Triplophysa tibetana]